MKEKMIRRLKGSFLELCHQIAIFDYKLKGQWDGFVLDGQNKSEDVE